MSLRLGPTGRSAAIATLLAAGLSLGAAALAVRHEAREALLVALAAIRAAQTVHFNVLAISAHVSPDALSCCTFSATGSNTGGRPRRLPARRALTRPSRVRSRSGPRAGAGPARARPTWNNAASPTRAS
jgi:hypothetical protein